MSKRASALLAIALAATSATAATTPPATMQPGPAHRALDFLVGDWLLDGRLSMRGEVHPGEHRASIRWSPGGVWLVEELELPDTPVGDMFASARIAWDEAAGEYVRYWTDDQSPVVLPMRGRFTDDGRLVFAGSFEWTDGTVYHQSLEIRRTDDGWAQTGRMGTDPAALPINHEYDARPVPPPETTAAPPPAWLIEHMATMTAGSGRWIADNASYRSDAEPFDAYGTEWRYGPGDTTIRGRLFGLRGDEEQATFWEFRLAWHPIERRAIVSQYGAGGIALGTMTDGGDGATRIEQTLVAPDGSSSRVVHVTTVPSPGVHVTRASSIDERGTERPGRSYSWRRAKEASAGR